MKTAALHNLGCKVNACETEAMEQQLMEAGYEIVPFSERADIYVINTCTVTNTADHKSRQMLHRARRTNPDALVVAVGCYVQAAGESLIECGDADLIIGNDRKKDLVRLIESHMENVGTEADTGEPRADIIDINEPGRPFEELGALRPHEHTRAFVKIQDGCNQFCSYCAIPYARGRARSRRPEDVLEEVRGLAESGFKEVVLTGIHLSSYGSDLTGKKDGSPLISLIRDIHEIDGIERIRLGSLEPGIITVDFVRELSSFGKVCPHFHLSLQSGSDTVLKRMNRHYTAAEYLERCRIIRDNYEHPALTTDVIVGFPGETEEEFRETFDLVRTAGFYEIHVFKYSRRDGTPAADMPDQIPERVKAERSRQLMALGEEMKKDFESWYIGKEVEVLFEEAYDADEGRIYTGYTPEYLRVTCRSQEDLRNCIKRLNFQGR